MTGNVHVTYSECMSVASIQYAVLMCNTGEFIEHKMCVLIFPKTFVRNISHSKKNLASYDHKCLLGFM